MVMIFLQYKICDLNGINSKIKLQMKGKYRSLAPLLNRINQASNERRQNETEIKKLLQQIQKARTKLAASHQNFTTLVQQLLLEKNTIDQRVFKIVKFPHESVFTSTPNKLVKKPVGCNVSSVNESSSVIQSSESNTECIKNNTQPIERESAKLNTNRNNTQKLQREEVLLDPNDITKVFVEQPTVELATFPKYTSPLDNRDGINDPLTTVCPYDLLGVCKDKECCYMHCS